ncbi:conjugal transfer pilus assembly protein TraW [Sphingobium sp. B1D7B]|uniref:type-F conjugative transfer system protein TraW n=1 Tax=Sphingobium sp. B1D7B TaxID=2940578 RepID=UPI002224C372|nr:type-F conjugative transfer system protein TraW [Sphingobium sp. B1D7B]MCW2406886.1 conjugal transfer pilus assembly protein TraW [Sphingobium sp. B1D7B]
MRALIVCATLVLAAPVAAKDYGQHGALFVVTEPDLLMSIQSRLKRLEADGSLERMNREMAERTERKVRRPDPVVGITKAQSLRSWTYDPAIVIEKDIKDTAGNVIVRAGQRANPLNFIQVRQALVFIDGDNREQLRWALASYTAENAKIIMVKGAPLDAMTAHQRQFFFDQGGYLVDRFGIRAVPAIVTQAGKVMKVREGTVKDLSR